MNHDVINSFTQKAIDWKKLFIEYFNVKGVDEKTPWCEISDKVELIPEQILDFLIKATDEIGTFTEEENEFLHSLPGFPLMYEAFEEILFSSIEGDVGPIWLENHPQLPNSYFVLRNKEVKILECYIPGPDAVIDIDFVIFDPCCLSLTFVSFVKELPERFLKLQREFLSGQAN